jgi:hypothetical protein
MKAIKMIITHSMVSVGPIGPSVTMERKGMLKYANNLNIFKLQHKLWITMERLETRKKLFVFFN